MVYGTRDAVRVVVDLIRLSTTTSVYTPVFARSSLPIRHIQYSYIFGHVWGIRRWRSATVRRPPSILPRYCRRLSRSRLIARRDAEGVPVEGAGLIAGRDKLRHRYILEPIDATARVALSVDPMDR